VNLKGNASFALNVKRTQIEQPRGGSMKKRVPTSEQARKRIDDLISSKGESTERSEAVKLPAPSIIGEAAQE
jgi:hypothetical protein